MAQAVTAVKLHAKSYINGKWVEGEGETVEVISPIDGSVIGTFKACSTEQVEEAVKGAKEAQKKWAALPVLDRLDIINRAIELWEERGEEIAQLISKEMGKTIREAREEIYDMLLPISKNVEGDVLRFRGETLPSTADRSNSKKIMTTFVPIGVIGVITPWNFPVSISSEVLPHALAMGNATVYKPSEKTPFSTELWVRLWEEAGVPKGVLNMVHGLAEVGSSMVEHDDVGAISFTGSTAVGEKIAKAAGLKKHLFELGGSDPMIIMDDANVDEAVKSALIGCFYNAGQVCTCTERVLVHEDVHDEFVSKLAAEVRKIRVGNPLDEKTDMGPLSSQAVLNKVNAHVQDAVEKGAEIVCGGTHEGLYYQPTILTGVTPEMEVGSEETFGPIAPIIKFSTREEAVEMANDTKYGLTASAFTSGLENAWYLSDHIQSGMVYINEDTNYWELLAPFGGVKKSGNGGRVLGKYAVEGVCEIKQVVMEPSKVKK